MKQNLLFTVLFVSCTLIIILCVLMKVSDNKVKVRDDLHIGKLELTDKHFLGKS